MWFLCAATLSSAAAAAARVQAGKQNSNFHSKLFQLHATFSIAVTLQRLRDSQKRMMNYVRHAIRDAGKNKLSRVVKILSPIHFF